MASSHTTTSLLFFLLLLLLSSFFFLHISEAQIQEGRTNSTKKLITNTTNTTTKKNQTELLTPKRTELNHLSTQNASLSNPNHLSTQNASLSNPNHLSTQNASLSNPNHLSTQNASLSNPNHLSTQNASLSNPNHLSTQNASLSNPNHLSTQNASLSNPNHLSTQNASLSNPNHLSTQNASLSNPNHLNTQNSNSTELIPKEQQQQQAKTKTIPTPTVPSLELEDDGTTDLISEFRDLPSKLHQTLLPDLEKMSTKSKAYITLANKEFTETFTPIVGRKRASTMGTFTSAAFLLFIPISLVTVLLLHFRDHLSLQKILVSIHTYLAIYFSTLAFTSLITGLEPLKFFHATSPVAYLCTQMVQTLGYTLYLLLQLIDLVVVFTGKDGLGFGTRMMGLAQVIVSLAVGLHYYVAVFHHAILDQPPKTNLKIYTVYGVSFLVLSVFAGAERRRKDRFLNVKNVVGKKN